jgi:pimeloyl-ACP methyl ester carboxylesterase
MWDAEVAWLRDHARVLCFDLRGQGRSDFPTETFSNHRDVLGLLDELGLSDATLVGLSAGAQVALDVALAAPQRVRRLVLVSPSLQGYVPTEMPPFMADLMTALQARDFESANEVLLASSIMAVPPEHADAVRLMVEENERFWTLPYSLVELPPSPAIEVLEKVEAPTLVLVGASDLEAIRHQSELLEQRLPNVRRVQVAGGGHLLNLTSPKAFREAVGVFLGLEEN